MLKMVFVKVRETYDLHTIPNKMSVIAITTPSNTILKRNWSGLLMNCKKMRMVSADVVMACASLQNVDPLGVGTTDGDIAPEDVFNPILYKAMTNESMSTLERRIYAMGTSIEPGANLEVAGESARVDSDTATPYVSDFDVYYGLLANAHGWRTANPQAGLQMRKLVPLVFEQYFTLGNNGDALWCADGKPVSTDHEYGINPFSTTDNHMTSLSSGGYALRGRSHPMPALSTTKVAVGTNTVLPEVLPGFTDTNGNSLQAGEIPKTVVGAIIVPPSRLHELYYRMTVEWTIEFMEIRSLLELADFPALNSVGANTHYTDYSFSAKSKGIDSALVNEMEMVSTNSDINKVM